ncbi:MAG: 50S ribosomal protein L9 [Patescibacteria group bacterium]
MRVIFLHDVPRVGRKYEVKDVNDGYAMNFLLPKKLAESATLKALAALEMRRKEIAVEREVEENLLLKNLEEIKDKVITLKEKADEKGHLFAQIHTKEIVAAMKREHRADIGEEFIVLEKPIKAVGEFEIPLEIKGKKSSFKLIVEAA